MKRLLTVILFAGALAACADSSQLVRYGNGTGRKLTASDSVYIAVPRDGAYGATIYTSSGTSTTQILQGALAKRVRHIDIGRGYQEFDDALKAAKEKSYSVLVYPTILSWEDRATEWSGIPDKVEIKIEVVDTSSGDTIDSAVVKGKSGLATFGGDHPQDLLPEPIEKFTATLF